MRQIWTSQMWPAIRAGPSQSNRLGSISSLSIRHDEWFRNSPGHAPQCSLWMSAIGQAHHRTARRWGGHEATLGLSATPERESDNGFESWIVPALGPIIYAYDYPEAKADGVIVDFELVNIEITLDGADVGRIPILSRKRNALLLRATDRAGSKRMHEAASTRIARAAGLATRIPWAVKLALEHRDERVIIFHERVASLGRIAELLSEFGQNSVSYHSQLMESHRRDNLRLFRRGMVNMLVTCRALDEGANVPEANVAIVARSTKSTRQRIQRLGRVLRPAPGKAHATVYTFYSGKAPRARLADETADLEGIASVVWKRGIVQ